MADMILTKLREKKEALENALILKQAEARPVRAQMAQLDREIGTIQQEIREVDKEISRVKTKPTVSDHAVLRYLERKYGFDFESVRKEIMTDPLRDAIKVGASGFKIDGGKFVINDNKVVTFVTK